LNISGTESAVINTNKGTIKLALFPGDAPNTVASFVELAESGFYDHVKFHRVVPGFVAQGGDPQTREVSSDDVRRIVTMQGRGMYEPGEPVLGTGGPGWNQKAEFNSRKHDTGTPAMARFACGGFGGLAVLYLPCATALA